MKQRQLNQNSGDQTPIRIKAWLVNQYLLKPATAL
jgi:hypothetical protein